MPSRARALRLPCHAVALHCPGGATLRVRTWMAKSWGFFLAVDILAVEPRHSAALAARSCEVQVLLPEAGADKQCHGRSGWLSSDT